MLSFLATLVVAAGGFTAVSASQDQVANVDRRAASSAIVLGYYTNWAQYRPSPWKFYPENIDPTLFTHLAYAFAIVEDNTYKIKPFEWNDVLDYGDGGMYKRFHSHVRSKNPSIKTVISLGGWTFSQNYNIFNKAAATAAAREQFANNIISFTRQYNFDGVDIDWEYPGSADRNNFTLLLKLLRSKIASEAASTGKTPLLLTVAVSAAHTTLQTRYDAKQVGELCDWVGLMTYDLYGAWETKTRSHTQLYPMNSADSSEMAVSRSVEEWNKYVPASKLLLGLATYGRSFTLTSPSQKTSYACNMQASAKTPAPAGTYTRENGFMSYYEIQELIKGGGQVCEDSSKTYTSSVQSGSTWIGYDTLPMIGAKVNYAKSKGLGGIMFWALDLDDFKNGYPVICYASKAMLSGTSAAAPASPAAVATTTKAAAVTTTKAQAVATTTKAAAVTTTKAAAVTTTTAAAGGSSSEGVRGCKSKYSHISDKWCADNGCAGAFPTFCKKV